MELPKILIPLGRTCLSLFYTVLAVLSRRRFPRLGRPESPLMDQIRQSPLKRQLKATLLELARHERGYGVWPALGKTVAPSLSKSRRAVINDVNELVELGILVPLTNRRGGQGRPTKFRIDVSKLPPRTQEHLEYGPEVKCEATSHFGFSVKSAPRSVKFPTAKCEATSHDPLEDPLLKKERESPRAPSAPSEAKAHEPNRAPPAPTASTIPLPAMEIPRPSNEGVLKRYRHNFESANDAPPTDPTAEDRRRVDALVASYGEATVLRALDAYFAAAKADRFIKDCGYSIGLFSKQFNSWLTAAAPPRNVDADAGGGAGLLYSRERQEIWARVREDLDEDLDPNILRTLGQWPTRNDGRTLEIFPPSEEACDQLLSAALKVQLQDAVAVCEDRELVFVYGAPAAEATG